MNKIWKYTKAFFMGALKGVQGLGTFALGLLVVFFLVGALTGGDEKPTVEDGSVLVLWPTGVIVEQPRLPEPFDNAIQLPGSPPVTAEESIHDLVKALDSAILDDRLGALAIYTDNLLGAAPAHLHTLVAKIKAFKETGRPVYAIGSSYTQSDYLLASTADQIFMNPAGNMLLTGYASYRLYYQEMLEKIDASVNVFRVGTFKSAVEPYLRNDMSPAAREANKAFLGALWEDYLGIVRDARSLSEEELDSRLTGIVDDLRAAGGDIALMAKKKGLVDALVTKQEMRRQLIDKHGSDSSGETFKQINHRNYLAAIEKPPLKRAKKKIAVITAQGEIIPGTGPISVSASSTVVSYIRQARRDSNTAAIVLRIDSPGGSAYASELIRQELVEAQNQGIPVIASMGPVAASGGYWIAATADEIWAQPTTITGSIGIFGVIPTFEKTIAKAGVYSDGVGTTTLSGAFDPTRAMSGTARDLVQLSIESGYDAFLSLVAQGREMTKEEVNEIAQGRVWIGSKAHELGLVDSLGDFQDAVASAAKRADISDYEVVFYRDKLDPFDKFLIDLMNTSADSGLPDLVGDPMPTNQPLVSVTGSPLVRALSREVSALPGLTGTPDPQGRYVLCLLCAVDSRR